MNICFFSVNHFGDNYFSQPFILNICKNNPGLSFKYWFFLGHFVFDNMVSNLHFLEYNTEVKYNQPLLYNSPPEDVINTDIYLKTLFIQNAATPFFTFSYNNTEYIAFNIWCASFGCDDICVKEMKTCFQNRIEQINIQFGLHIKNEIHNDSLLPILKSDVSIEPFLLWKHNQNHYNQKYIFIYNFKPRSFPIHYNINDIIHSLCIKFPNIIFIIPNYSQELSDLSNIKFCDSDFNCIPEPSCKNLFILEKIQRYCSLVFVIPSGSSWMFFNSDLYIENKQNIFMIENENYSNKLNNWYHFCKNNNNENIIHNISINNMEECIRNYLY
jgi:hypothetical protein